MLLKQKITLFFFLLFGTIIQVIPVIKSGLNYSFGTGFWGPLGHDGIWHLSLINHISNPFNINMPIYAGEKLVNYHPFFDILISFLSHLTHVPTSIWLFQLFPLISSLIFLYLSFYLGNLMTKSFKGGILLLSINAVSNSFGWIVSFIRQSDFSGESIFWAMQSPSNQINPPYILSIILILVLLIIVYKHPSQTNLSLKESIIIYLILSILPITKSYSAVIGFSIFGLYSLITFIKYRQLNNIITFTLSLFTAILLFIQYNPHSSGLLLYKPFWFLKTMIESQDRLLIPYFANMYYALTLSNTIGPRLIILITALFFVFIVGNYSWRLLGLFVIFKKPNFFKLVLLLNIVTLTLIPTFFIQSGTSWNTIQFLYYALFLSNIFLFLYLNSILHKIYGKIIIGVIFLTYFISYYGTLPNYLSKIPPTTIPVSEMKALVFLSQQLSGTVLTVPYDKYQKTNFPFAPVPLYANETTSYVSAYSRHLVYLEDEMNLNNSNYDVASRKSQALTFFTQKNIFADRGFLVNNKISYIYITGLQMPIASLLNIQGLSLEKIYENSDTIIYKVQR